MGEKAATIVLVCAGLLVGCVEGGRNRAGEARLPETKRVYVSQGMPSSFDAGELAEIRSGVVMAGFAEKDVWFVHVLLHEGGHFRVTVYLLPEWWAGRVTKGKMFGWDSMLSIPSRALLANLGEKWPEPSGYVQVLPAAVPEELRNEQREGAALPFVAPVDLSDEDIVASVDAARAAVRDPLLPVRSVEAEEGVIKVMTGELRAPLYGQGEEVTLKRAGRGYRVIGVGFWVS